jgi:hypothetical protein
MILSSLNVVRGGSHLFWQVGILRDMQVASVFISPRGGGATEAGAACRVPKASSRPVDSRSELFSPSDNQRTRCGSEPTDYPRSASPRMPGTH